MLKEDSFKGSRVGPNNYATPPHNRFQRTFWARIGLVGHLRINCVSRTAPTIVLSPASSSSSPPPTNSDNSSDPPLPSPSCSSSSCSSYPSLSSSFSSSSSSSSSTTTTTTTAPTVAAQAAVSHITNHDTTTDTTPTSPDSSDEDQDSTCPHCDRTVTSLIGLVGHLQSIAQRRATQCLEHQPTPTALSSTAHTALAPSDIAWAFSATCAYMRAELTTIPTHPPRPTHPPCPAPPLLHRHTRPSPLPPLQLTPTPPTSHAHTAHARSPHTSAWSVTCESIAQRLANQCLEHPSTPTTLAFTAHIAIALSGIA
nr:unnamed protein product [Spirometra erinaceieuropaei]